MLVLRQSRSIIDLIGIILPGKRMMLFILPVPRGTRSATYKRLLGLPDILPREVLFTVTSTAGSGPSAAQPEARPRFGGLRPELLVMTSWMLPCCCPATM